MIDLGKDFDIPKKLFSNNFNKINIHIHPDYQGLFLCYQEVFKALKSDLSLWIKSPYLYIWKDPNIQGYTIVNACYLYLFFSKNLPTQIELMIYNYPNEPKNLELLRKMSSLEFINFLSSCNFDIERLNPKKLQSLINQHIHPEIIFELNQQNSYKPHYEMSLDVLAKFLSISRNKLNYKNKIIQQTKDNVFQELMKDSKNSEQILNNPNFILTPDKIWQR